MVEFAIVVPLLLALVFGIIEFGIMIYDKAMITNACREGARAGILYTIKDDNGDGKPDRQARIQDVVDNYLSTYLITFGTANTPTITYNPTDPDILAVGSDTYLSVTVNYNYGFLLVPALIGNIAPQVTLSSTSTMRVE